MLDPADHDDLTVVEFAGLDEARGAAEAAGSGAIG